MVTIPELWYPSPNYSTSRGAYNKVVLHTTEGALKIRDLGNWFANPSAGCSSHHGADNYEHLFGAYVYENHKAWTQGNANPYCLSLEMCGYSWNWSRETWLGKTQLINNAAEWVHYCVVKYNIPWKLLSNAEAQDPNVRGICEHVNFGSWGSGHNDCGNCPVDVIFDKARNWGGGSGSTEPAPSGGDFMPSSVYVDGKLHLACVWSDGRVNYRSEDDSWYAVDPVAANKAKSGVDITATPTGTLIITYTNSSGKVCTWQKNVDAPKGDWGWYDRGGNAK